MSFTFRQGDLPKLDLQLDHGSDFTAWHTQWESYKNLRIRIGKRIYYQTNTSPYAMSSREILSIIQNLGLTEEQRENVDEIIRAIKCYVEGHTNETVE